MAPEVFERPGQRRCEHEVKGAKWGLGLRETQAALESSKADFSSYLSMKHSAVRSASTMLTRSGMDRRSMFLARKSMPGVKPQLHKHPRPNTEVLQPQVRPLELWRADASR